MGQDIVERLRAENKALALGHPNVANTEILRRMEAAEAEVARLNESVDRYQQQWAENAPAVKYKQQCDALRAEVVALRAENEALQRNATAYLESAEASCCAEFVGAALRGLEVAELRIAAQMIVQAHEDGRDMQGPIDQMQRLLDAAPAAKEGK